MRLWLNRNFFVGLVFYMYMAKCAFVKKKKKKKKEFQFEGSCVHVPLSTLLGTYCERHIAFHHSIFLFFQIVFFCFVFNSCRHACMKNEVSHVFVE